MKKTFKKLLKINREINSFLKSSNNEFDENFGMLLEEKNSLIENLKSLKKSSEQEFSQLKASECKDDWQKIQELENENLNLIKNRKNQMCEEIINLKTQAKVLSSYKFKKDQEPRLFDDSC